MDLIFNIKKNADEVFAFLTDPEKFVSVHPVIYKVDVLPNGDWFVHERLKFGFIPVSFTYIASVKGNEKERKIIIKATVKKMTEITMSYEIITGDITCIKENLEIKSKLPVKKTMQRIFRNQHTKLFSNIEKANF